MGEQCWAALSAQGHGLLAQPGHGSSPLRWSYACARGHRTCPRDGVVACSPTALWWPTGGKVFP
jgi:hypothetical protein